MKTLFIATISIFVAFCSFGQYYQSKDLTRENVFTNNIEGPNTDRHHQLFVVNFLHDGTLGRVQENGEVELFVTLPEGSVANAIVFDRQGDFLLADWKGHNILKVDAVTKFISVYCHSDKFNQPNDLCINKQGQLFASDPNWKGGTGQLWRIETDGVLHLLVDSMGTTNGIALSPDETTLYVNESVQRKIWAFSVDETGNLSNKRLFMEFPDFGLDGMKCDLAGNLFVARYDKGVIAMLSPAGKLIREVALKGKKASNLTFGGQDGKTCFVTLQDRKCVEYFRSEIPGKAFLK